MKSLLVDALRQLEEDKAPASAPEPAADSAAPDALELTVGEAPAAPADRALSDATPPEIDTGELALETDDAPGHGLDTPTLGDHTFDDDAHPLAATMALDVDSGDLANTIIAQAKAGVEQIADNAVGRDTPRLQRIAILTPVLSLFLGTASAGGYFAYSYAGALNLNADLGALPTYVGDSVDVDTPGADDKAFVLAANTPSTPNRRPLSTSPAAAPASSAAAPSTPAVPRQATSPTPEDLAYPVLEKAYAAWQTGDTAAAERLYRDALTIAPRHPNALSGLGAVLLASDRADEAKPVYARLLALEPDNATAVAALLGEGQESSVEEIHALIEHHPDSAPLYFALGSAFARDSDWVEARVAFEEAFNRSPLRADYAFNLAVSLDRIGRYGEAESLYHRALELGDGGQTVDRAIVVARLNELSAVAAGKKP